ncbi:hypothetical protein RhiirB3_456351, partial [Rhizophagus irregularis]
ARRRFKKGYNFSEKQVFALIPKQTAGRKKEGAVSNTPDTTQEIEPEEGTVNVCQISPKETIRDLAERIIRDNISEKEVEVIAKALSGTASNASAGLSRLTRLRRELKALGASKKIISATFIPDITCSANKIQKENRLLRENEGIYYPDHFSLESVKERLDSYVVSNIPDKQALADVMIMLCIRPGEIKDLHIFNGNVTGYGKNRDQQDIPRVFRSLEKNEERAKQLLIWIQEAISSGQLRDPGKPGVLWFNTFLKKDEFLPEIGKPLLPSSLRKLGAVFAVVSHGSKNLSEAMTIATQSLGLDEQNTRAYKALSGQIWALEKRLEDYHIKYVKLKRKVNLLEDELEDELDDLDECVDRGAVVDIIIHEIVPSLIGKKGLRGAVHRGRSSYSSESSEGSDSVKTIVIRENKAIPHKQQRRARPRKINRSKERVVPELQQEVYIISLKLTLDRLA